MAGFGRPLRAGQVLPHGRLQRLQQGAFIETTTQGLFTGEIHSDAGTDPSPNEFDTCRWFRTGRMGTVYWTGVIPSGFDPGSDLYHFTMPFSPDPEYYAHGGSNDSGHRIGEGKLKDSETGNNSRVTVAQFTNNVDNERVVFLGVSESNGSVTAGGPIPWSESDAIQFRGRYPVDPRQLP